MTAKFGFKSHLIRIGTFVALLLLNVRQFGNIFLHVNLYLFRSQGPDDSSYYPAFETSVQRQMAAFQAIFDENSTKSAAAVPVASDPTLSSVPSNGTETGRGKPIATNMTPQVVVAEAHAVQLNETNKGTETGRGKPVSTPMTPQVAVAEVHAVPLNETNKHIVINGKPYSLDARYLDASVSSLFPLPKPVIVVGLPKAGTSTIHDFFRRAGYKSGHWEVQAGKGWGRGKRNLIGICMKKALRQSLPLLKTCGNFDVWAQMDVSESEKECVFPQIEYLEQIHKEAPNATFLFNGRDLNKWASSVTRWQGLPQNTRKRKPSMSQRLASCPSLGLTSPSEDALRSFYLQHVQRIRQFVKDHPSHALLEIDIADPETRKRMARAFKIPSIFWGHANHNVPSVVVG